MARYEVVCEDGLVRHHESFSSKREAEDWEWWGHLCLANHSIREAAYMPNHLPFVCSGYVETTSIGYMGYCGNCGWTSRYHR